MRAFTLLELLIHLALFTLLMSGSMQSMFLIREYGLRNRAHAHLLNESFLVMNEIEAFTRYADSIRVTHRMLIIEDEEMREVRLEVDDKSLLITRNGGSFPLLAAGFAVEDIEFTRTGMAGSSTDPDTLSYSLILSTQPEAGPKIREELARSVLIEP